MKIDQGYSYAISLKQPWAYHIFNSNKDVENRTWRLPDVMIERPVFIHASKTLDHVDDSFFVPKNLLTFGAVIGAVKFTGCCQNSQSKWAVPGQYHWEIAEEKMILDRPILLRGKLGFFKVPMLIIEDEMDFDEMLNQQDKMIKQLEWSFDDTKAYLKLTYGVVSRHLMTNNQLLKFHRFLEAKINEKSKG
jgi:hypothetical protein